jgi:hypothetical protein
MMSALTCLSSLRIEGKRAFIERLSEGALSRGVARGRGSLACSTGSPLFSFFVNSPKTNIEKM